MKLLSFIFIGLFGQTISAKCTDINNLRPPLVEITEKKNLFRTTQTITKTPRHQDSIGWCYAHAAADLLSHRLGKEVSAVDLANAYSSGSWDLRLQKYFGFAEESNIEGGHAKQAANKGLNRGLCLEKNLPSSDFNFSRNYDNYQKEMADLEKIFHLYYRQTTTPSRLNRFGANIHYKKSDHELKRINQNFRQQLSCRAELFADWQSIFPNLSIDQLMNALSQSSASYQFLRKMIEKSCEPRLSFNNLKVSSVNRNQGFSLYDTYINNVDQQKEHERRASVIMNKIDEQLNKGDIIAVSYSSSILRNPANANYQRPSDHASTIVARRYNSQKNQCEYLLRNTWGRGCSYYASSYDCDNGHIWLPQEVIKKSVTGVDYLEN